MTTTQIADDPLEVGPSDSELERPRGGRPELNTAPKVNEQPQGKAGSRRRNVFILSIVAAVQLAWMVLLGYGLLELLKWTI
jgi:hypothetical protein